MPLKFYCFYSRTVELVRSAAIDLASHVCSAGHWSGRGGRHRADQSWSAAELPPAPQLAAESAEPAVVAEAHVQPGAPLRTLLYVEDNTAHLKVVEQLIARRPDMRMLSALNGNLGIEMARASLPDVILMDIALPGISGIQALDILRDDPVTAHIPVLAISAYAQPGDIKKGMKAGFFRYLLKPIKLNEFLEAMDLALGSCRQKPINGST